MKQNFLLGAMALAGLFASCSQTEMEEAANVPQKGNEVTVTVAPSADFTQPRTRAGSNQQLRYIAELWEEDKTTDPATTKKMIARTEQAGADANKFTFDIEQQGDYVILFWADYIAADAQKTDKTITRSSGGNTFTVNFQGYKDNKFTTDGSRASKEGLQEVRMKTDAVEDNFYNSSLDGFCGKAAFTKGTDIVSLAQVTLKRPLCKYIFTEKTANLSGISKVVMKSFNYYNRYSVYEEKTTTYNIQTELSVNILNSSEKQLFSFYSFGEKSNGTLASGHNMTFSFTASQGSSKKYKECSVYENNIPCRANYIYTVSGSFVQEDLTGPTVNVDVTCNDNWTEGSKDL